MENAAQASGTDPWPQLKCSKGLATLPFTFKDWKKGQPSGEDKDKTTALSAQDALQALEALGQPGAAGAARGKPKPAGKQKKSLKPEDIVKHLLL